MIEIAPIQIMAVNIIIGFIVPGIKPQGDDCSKQKSTDEQINGNAIANYFGQNSYLISSLKLMLETGDFWVCQIRDLCIYGKVRFKCDL
jgi:hypothetical protein